MCSDLWRSQRNDRFVNAFAALMDWHAQGVISDAAYYNACTEVLAQFYAARADRPDRGQRSTAQHATNTEHDYVAKDLWDRIGVQTASRSPDDQHPAGRHMKAQVPSPSLGASAVSEDLAVSLVALFELASERRISAQDSADALSRLLKAKPDAPMEPITKPLGLRPEFTPGHTRALSQVAVLHSAGRLSDEDFALAQVRIVSTPVNPTRHLLPPDLVKPLPPLNTPPDDHGGFLSKPTKNWKGPGWNWSYDWCNRRRLSHCWHSTEVNQAASALEGYTVWVPRDRGVCPFQKWKDQEHACPYSEPGPHVPGGAVAATVPYEEGGQHGGVPGPAYHDPQDDRDNRQ